MTYKLVKNLSNSLLLDYTPKGNDSRRFSNQIGGYRGGIDMVTLKGSD